MPNSIEERLAEIDKQIADLYNKRDELTSELSQVEAEAWCNKFDEWMIGKDSCLVLVPKGNRSEYQPLIKTIVVEDVNTPALTIDTVTSTYRMIDYDYEYKTIHELIHFSQLSYIENEYNIYLLDICQLVIVQHWLSSLSVTIENYLDYGESIKEVADRIIS